MEDNQTLNKRQTPNQVTPNANSPESRILNRN